MHDLGSSLREHIERMLPGAEVLSVAPLAPDVSARDRTHKAIGYGAPIRIEVRESNGRHRTLVFHTEKANDFGHDRRADRAANAILAFDTFPRIPGHVRPLDLGALEKGTGRLRSLADVDEFFVITEFAPGRVYADDLRQIAAREARTPLDVARSEGLVKRLVEVHQRVSASPGALPL